MNMFDVVPGTTGLKTVVPAQAGTQVR